VTILLLCCLVIYIGGYHLVYAVYQYGIKNEMKAYLSTHTDLRYGVYLDFLVNAEGIEDPAFEWEEENEEFKYKGDWYDVVSVKNSTDSIHICAIKDDRENELEKGLSAIHGETHSSSGAAPVSFFKFFPAFYFSNTHPTFFSQQDAVIYHLYREEVLLPVSQEVNTPPPRCWSCFSYRTIAPPLAGC
jgi:hypothetical protein